MKSFDVVVIGAGPAGYVAAIRCAQLGLKTACAEEWVGKDGKPALGGTCLNVGCIPSKALLDASEHYHRLAAHENHGIEVGDIRLDIPAVIARKDAVVQGLTGGIAGLFRKKGVTWLQGRGTLLPGKRVRVSGGDQDEEVEAAHVILATGSVPRTIKGVDLDGERIVDSSGALEFQEVPGTFTVIGAGVIGLELGSVWNRFGSKVMLLEAMEQFLPSVDEQVAGLAIKEFREQGLDIRLGARVLSAQVKKDRVEVDYEDGKGRHQHVCDKLCVAVGRRPQTDGLAEDGVDLLLDESGYVHVNDHCETNLPGVYAVGDVVRGPMLAHKGEEEGIMVAERIAGQAGHVNYDTIPWVIYTHPEIAWVGKTERQLKAAKIPYKTGSFPVRANGRARAAHQDQGLVKVLAHAETDELLGVHIFAVSASEMIAEAVVAMEFRASAEDLARIVHAHPTLSETVHEAALAVGGRALHF